MVHAEHAAGAVKVLHQQLRFLQHLMLVQQAEAAVVDPVVQGGALLHHQRQHADVFRVHGVESLGSLDGVLLQQLGAAQAGDGGDGQSHAAAADLLAHSHDLGGGMALAHEGKDPVAAGFQPHVDHGEALCPEGPQFLLRPQADAAGRGVAGDPLALREQFPDGVQNGIQLAGLPDQGIAVRQENAADAAVALAGHLEILQNFVQRPQGEVLLLVHAAEGAGIVAASVGHLDDETVGLGGRPVDHALVSHKPSFSSAAIRTQVQNTVMAFSTSSTGGKEGAIRMLLSLGSMP